MYYEKFEKLLKTHNAKPSQVAKATGISTSTLSSWKNGHYTPKNDKLQLIADYFQVPLSFFWEDAKDIEKDFINYKAAVPKGRIVSINLDDVDMLNSFTPKKRQLLVKIMSLADDDVDVLLAVADRLSKKG